MIYDNLIAIIKSSDRRQIVGNKDEYVNCVKQAIEQVATAQGKDYSTKEMQLA